MTEKIYNKNIIINMPEHVREIIHTLQAHGYEAFAVGGCVRDSILGKEPKDWDITTSALPEETKALFKRTLDTGIKHGTVTIMIKGTGYEVTTYRVDGKYEDGRHPSEVTFTASLKEDLRRRDFTINAMAYNDESGVVDCFGGVCDLNGQIIRCVGNPTERFTEDALRMLRAVRFSAVLNFDIHDDTLSAIATLASSITKISRERIQVELEKLIMSDHPEKISLLYNTKLIHWIFEENSFTSSSLAYEYSSLSAALCESPKDHYIRWAIFNSYVSADNILKSLKFDNATVKICSQLVKYRDEPLPDTEPELRKCIVKIGKDIFIRYYIPYRKILKNADNDLIESVINLYNIITERGDCLSIKELAVNGGDLAQTGVEPGKKMGEILNLLFNLVLNDHTKNRKDTLLEIAKKYT